MKKIVQTFQKTLVELQAFTFDILIPMGREVRYLLPGSGIVADPNPTEKNHRRVYFEGNKYGAVNLHTYEERLLNAADGLRTNYPTVARMSLNEEDFSEFLIVGSLYVAFVPTQKTHTPLSFFPNAISGGVSIGQYKKGVINSTIFDYKDEHLDALNAYIASYKSSK